MRGFPERKVQSPQTSIDVIINIYPYFNENNNQLAGYDMNNGKSVNKIQLTFSQSWCQGSQSET